MVTFSRLVVGLAFSFGCAPAGLADKPNPGPRAKVEFRRAEIKPRKGLTEATVVGTTHRVYLHKSPDATVEDIAEARATEDALKNPAIEIIFTKKGAKKMAKLSKEHKGKPVALMVDGKVISAPRIIDKFSEKGVFVGKFTKQEVEKLVKSINAK